MITTLSEETVDSHINVPRAIFLTIALSTVLYISVSVVYAGLVSLDTINESAPLSAAFTSAGAPTYFAHLIGIGALGNTFTTLLASIIGIPRVVYCMACDGLLPAWCGQVTTMEFPNGRCG